MSPVVSIIEINTNDDMQQSQKYQYNDKKDLTATPLVVKLPKIKSSNTMASASNNNYNNVWYLVVGSAFSI